MHLIVLMGPPLAGKGTQSAYLEKQGYFHFSAGASLRRMAKEDSDRGRAIARLIEAGNMVPGHIVDDMVRGLVAQKRAEGAKGIVLDGYPRLESQADHLDALAAREKLPLTVIELHAPLDELNRRREKRVRESLAAGQEPRRDDREEVFRHRMDVYRAETAPLSARYAAAGRLHRIGVKSAPAGVSAEIGRILARRPQSGPGPRPGV
jgi:adenylate kinase